MRSLSAVHLTWNLAGAVLPALAGLATIPVILRWLGPERFGLLAYCWLLVAYFSVFDLGLTRALTRLASGNLPNRSVRDLPGLLATSMSLIWSFALVGSMTVALLSPYAVDHWLHVPAHMRDEAIWSFWLTTVGLPFLIAAGGWRAILEALGRFDLSNKVQIPLAIVGAAAPIAALLIIDSLVAVSALLSVVRFLGWMVVRTIVLNLAPDLRYGAPKYARWFRPLVSFGGWATISNVVGPVMVYVDRLIIGGVISLTAVTYYVTSYELATRAWALAGAVIGVLFPVLSSLLCVDNTLARDAYRRALVGVYVLTLAPLAVLSVFAPEVLSLWLGADFSASATVALRILAVGVLFNCLAQVSLTVLQAAGRTGLIAAIHLVEISPYVLLLLWLAENCGISGVAAAWTVRAMVDAFVMFAFANRIIPESGRTLLGYQAVMAATALLLAAGFWTAPIVLRSVLVAAILMCCVAVAWRVQHQAAVGRVCGTGDGQ